MRMLYKEKQSWLKKIIHFPDFKAKGFSDVLFDVPIYCSAILELNNSIHFLRQIKLALSLFLLCTFYKERWNNLIKSITHCLWAGVGGNLRLNQNILPKCYFIKVMKYFANILQGFKSKVGTGSQTEIRLDCALTLFHYLFEDKSHPLNDQSL